MNGRMYDPQLRRFLSPDNHIQDPYNTLSYDRFGYVWNNPLMAGDPSGEFIIAALIGAAIGVLTNGINNSMNGRGFFKGWARAALIGGASGVLSFGIGEIANGISGSLLSTGISNASAFQFVAHGLLGGAMSELNGGKFVHGFISGGVGSIVGGVGSRAFKNANGFGRFVGAAITGGVAGGIGSSIAGGSFWDGFRNGAISAGLNHGLHELTEPPSLIKRLQRRLQRLHRRFQRSLNKISENFSGFSIEVEFASPFHMIGEGRHTGVGFEFGILTRNGETNFFTTTKWSNEAGIAFGIDAGPLFASASENNVLNNSIFAGSGIEMGINLSYGGASIGGNPSFVHPYSASDFKLIRPSLGFGIEGGSLWQTRTTVYD